MKLNYQFFGSGKRTIVLLHYFGGKADSWQWVVKRLTKKFRVMVPNLPGFGGTEPLPEPSIYYYALYINNCIKAENLEDYVICGHSMSAKLMLYATQINSVTLPECLILIAPSPPTREKISDEEKERMLIHPDEKQARITVENSSVRSLSKKKFQLAVNSQLETDPKTWDWWIKTGMHNDISGRIKGITTPTFVICAKKDPVIPLEDIFEEVLPYLHEPRLIQLGRCGHLIPMESPRRLSKRIRRILKQL